MAAERVRVIRHRLRSRAEGYPAEEYKARHLLREKHRAALVRLLDERGPVHGRADACRARVQAASPLFPVLNPLCPAIRRTAARQGAGGAPVTLVHDQRNALTPVPGARRSCGHPS